MRIQPLFILTMFAGTTVCAQDSLTVHPEHTVPRTSAIVSSVPFEGTNYCIKVVPLTTRNIDHMPMFTPLSFRDRIVELRTTPAPSDTLLHRLRKFQEEKKEQRPPR